VCARACELIDAFTRRWRSLQLNSIFIFFTLFTRFTLFILFTLNTVFILFTLFTRYSAAIAGGDIEFVTKEVSDLLGDGDADFGEYYTPADTVRTPHISLVSLAC
jgi:hypothetical protein